MKLMSTIHSVQLSLFIQMLMQNKAKYVLGGHKVVCHLYFTFTLEMKAPNNQHCVKSVRVRSFSGPYFPAFRLNREPVRMRENMAQKNSEYEHFSRSAYITVWTVSQHCSTTMQT